MPASSGLYDVPVQELEVPQFPPAFRAQKEAFTLEKPYDIPRIYLLISAGVSSDCEPAAWHVLG